MNDNYEAKQPKDVYNNKAEELAQIILQNGISEQNEIFHYLRMILVKNRQEYIDRESKENNERIKSIEFARETLASIFVSDLK